jgi:c-di-GMP-binding flagellar brake protein YcgR
MQEDILKMQVGDVVQLQRIVPEKEQESRYTVTVIGFVPGKSILVTAPVIKGKVQFVLEDQRFAVRTLRGSNVIGFVATVMHTAVKPYPYLHLSFPEEVESIAVRNAERVETNMPALVKNTKNPDETHHWQPALIKDLSATGARFESFTHLGENGERLQIRFKLEVCNAEENIDLVAKIRNHTLITSGTDAGGVLYSTGTEFHMVNRFQQVLLHDHILEQRLQAHLG